MLENMCTARVVVAPEIARRVHKDEQAVRSMSAVEFVYCASALGYGVEVVRTEKKCAEGPEGLFVRLC